MQDGGSRPDLLFNPDNIVRFEFVGRLAIANARHHDSGGVGLLDEVFRADQVEKLLADFHFAEVHAALLRLSIHFIFCSVRTRNAVGIRIEMQNPAEPGQQRGFFIILAQRRRRQPLSGAPRNLEGLHAASLPVFPVLHPEKRRQGREFASAGQVTQVPPPPRRKDIPLSSGSAGRPDFPCATSVAWASAGEINDNRNSGAK